MHWAVKAAIIAVIGVVVAGSFKAFWSIYQNTGKIPGLEEASTKQQRDIVHLKAAIVTLMQRTGHPPTTRDLEELMSSVGDFGAGTAKFLRRADITVTGRPTEDFFAWVPRVTQDTLRRHVASYAAFSSTADPRVIGTLITSSMVSLDSGDWVFVDGHLRGTFSTWSVVLTPKDRTTADYFGAWTIDAKTIRASLRTVPVPKAVVPGPPPH